MDYSEFQSPRGDFGFLKEEAAEDFRLVLENTFQSPRGDFGFLKGDVDDFRQQLGRFHFNPLAGILVF